MINGNVGYAKMYFDARDIEKYMLSKLEDKYKDKPIILSNVTFDREYDETVEMHFTIFMGNEKVDSDSFFPSQYWRCDRIKGDMNDIATRTKE